MLFSGGLTLDLDVTYIAVLALFLIPLVVLNGLVFRPFLELFARRHEQLEGALQRAGHKLDEAEAKAKAFEAKIQVATSKGIEARNRIRAEAQKQMNARVEAERERVVQKVEGALADIERTRKESLAQAGQEARNLAELTATKLLGRGI